MLRRLAGQFSLRTAEAAFRPVACQARAFADEAKKVPHTIGDILTTKHDKGRWLWVGKDESVFKAIQKMTEAKVGCLVVLDNVHDAGLAKGGNIVGIVSERDYLTKVAVLGRTSAATNVTEIMTPASKIKTVNTKQKIVEAMDIMCKHNIRHMPIIDDGEMRGMLSIRDVTEALLAEKKDEMEQMAEYIKGSY
ncbi:unnamed protein product [Pedinophyceae sp. YPF-701]|nr:unnamed protein product [Pedinophyceae sp. YPF-701]